jgi:hypothetical protein
LLLVVVVVANAYGCVFALCAASFTRQIHLYLFSTIAASATKNSTEFVFVSFGAHRNNNRKSILSSKETFLKDAYYMQKNNEI